MTTAEIKAGEIKKSKVASPLFSLPCSNAQTLARIVKLGKNNNVFLRIPHLQGIRVCREMITFAAEKQPIGGMLL